jgi:zinc protease
MGMSKLSSLLACSLLLAGWGSTYAQKKDGKAPTLQSPAPTTPYSNVKRDSLLNGLQIITLERMGDPAVKCDLVIRAGAIYDLAGKTGLAKLTQETLLIVNPRLKEELESLQAKIAWGVDWDKTWFHIETPATSFENVMEIVARLLVVENVRPDAFKLASEEQLKQIKSRQASPAERADEMFLKTLYGDHPYGHNIDGDEATLAGIKQGDVYDHLRRFYLANNASAVITGNISHVRAMRAFKAYFGGWIKGQIVPPTFRPPMQVAQMRLVKVEAPDSPNIEMRGGVLGVRHTDPDFLITEVMAKILAARLLNEAQSTAREFSVKTPSRLLAGPIVASASVPADQALAFSRRVNESFTALATAPPTAEELTAAKSSLASDYLSRSVEFFLREIEIYSFPRNYPLNIAPRIETITSIDVQRVAKKLLGANALTVVVLGKVNESFKSNL